MIRQKNISNKTLAFGLFAILITGIMLNLGNTLIENNKVQAQQQKQQHQTLSSIPHNAKGHASHQIVNFQKSNPGQIYKGTVIFNSSKPVDIISYTEMTGEQNANTTIKIWAVGDNKFIPKTLLKNVTKGIVDFEGSGILAHSIQSIPYNVTFTINATSENGTGGSIILGPLVNIFK